MKFFNMKDRLLEIKVPHQGDSKMDKTTYFILNY
jgi:hypothetical protein